MRYRYEIQIQDPETGLWTLYEHQVPWLQDVKGWFFTHREERDRATQRKEVKKIVLAADYQTKLRVVELNDNIHYWQIVWEKGNWV
jgi:hypothetical protein